MFPYFNYSILYFNAIHGTLVGGLLSGSVSIVPSLFITDTVWECCSLLAPHVDSSTAPNERLPPLLRLVISESSG